MSKSSISLPTIRALSIIVVAGYVAIKGREWLPEFTSINLSPDAYTYLAYLFMGIVTLLSTRDPLKKIRESAKLRDEQSQNQSRHIKGSPFHNGSNLRVYRQPFYQGLLFVFGGVYFFTEPSSSHVYAATGQLSVGDIIVLIFSLGLFLTGIYSLRYRICVTDMTIKIRKVQEHEYAICDVETIKTSDSIRGIVFAVITFTDKSMVRVNGRKKDMLDLKNTLMAVKTL